MKRESRVFVPVTMLFALVLGVSLLWGCSSSQQQGGSAGTTEETATEETATEEAAATGDVDVAKVFPSWNADSESLAKLITYVKDVTDKNSPNYVEPEERVATFDMDGTVICEKAPVYVDYCLLLHRVLEDPDYKADPKYVEICKSLREDADQGIVDGDKGEQKNEALVKSFEGMKPEEVYEYVNNFLDTTPAEGFEGMTYRGSIYFPMGEVVNYLRANDFEVYIVSASEREIVRAIMGSTLGIAPDHIIGTDWEAKAADQKEDEDAASYTLSQGEEIVFSGVQDDECAKLNKVLYIEREIGRRPLLSFGNSSGDYAMLNYAQSNPNHPGMGFLVLCDDTVREYGDEERATKQQGEADEAGWTVFSMANDWATIYGEGVEKTQLRADAEAAVADAA